MLQITFIIFNLIVLGITLFISTFWPMAAWSLILILPTMMLSVYDMLQSY